MDSWVYSDCGHPKTMVHILSMPQIKLHILVDKDAESGWLTASCPALPGCITQAETEEQLKINIRESVMLWLEVQDGKELKSAQSAAGCGSTVHELILSF